MIVQVVGLSFRLDWVFSRELRGRQGCPLDFVLHLVVTHSWFRDVSTGFANITCLSSLPLCLPTRKPVHVLKIMTLGSLLLKKEHFLGGGGGKGRRGGWRMHLKSCKNVNQTFYLSIVQVCEIEYGQFSSTVFLIKTTACNMMQSKWGF